MSFKKNFGLRLRELRKSKGLSQEQLSEKLNIAQNTLSSLENGLHFCNAETIEKILAIFDINTVDLFNFGHLKNTSDLKQDINKMLDDNPDKVKEIWKIIHAIVDK